MKLQGLLNIATLLTLLLLQLQPLVLGRCSGIRAGKDRSGKIRKAFEGNC